MTNFLSQKSPTSSLDLASSAPPSAGAIVPGHLRRLIEALGGMDRSQKSTGAVAGLPEDSLVEILSRVPAKSLRRFRCVSKAWRDLIDDPLNRRKLPQTLEGFFFIDDRMFDDDDGDVEQFDFINLLARSVPLDIDRRFSFLTKLPEIETLVYEDSCNGLLLLKHRREWPPPFDMLGYIVCNPATKHWGTVPPCGCCQPSTAQSQRKTFLAFDPAVSSHFHLIQFWKLSWNEEGEGPFENPLVLVHAYSSETGMWSHSDEQGQLEGWRHQGGRYVGLQRAFVNGILHLIVSDLFMTSTQMVAVDIQGKTKRIITMPAVAEGRRWHKIPYIGQSQGRLHYINHHFDAHDCRHKQSSELSVWVLQDCDTQEWVLKHTVSFLRLFGRMTASWWHFDVVAIHPDCNVVFFLHPFNRLIAYDMDRKEASVVACFENEWYIKIAPYIPCFSESPALTDKH